MMGPLALTFVAAVTQPKSPTIDPKPVLQSLLHTAITVWPLWALLIAAAAAKLAFALWDEARLARSGIHEVDRMEGQAFEEFLATRFRRLGYDAKVTRYRGDYGADLVLSKDGVRTAVQAK